MIRELSILELEAAAKLGLEFWAEGALPGKLVPKVWIKNWTAFIRSEIGKIWGLYGAEGKLLGCLGALFTEDINDGELVATESFWFVTGEQRGQGIKLLLSFLTYARQRGVSRVIMMHLFNKNAEQVAKLYTRIGFKPVETHFVMSLNEKGT